MRPFFQEANFYGASKLIFQDKIPICLKATWMHGLGFSFHENVDSKILIHYQEDFLPIHLVNNHDSCKKLELEGIEAIAVGMPFLYASSHLNKMTFPKKFKRIFMPRHIVAGVNFHKSFEGWKKIISKYSCDAICLAGLEYKMALEKKFDFGNNLSILRGASAGDEDSLERVTQMFYSTKEIITDSIGSHLIYAGSCGTKVRIIDEIYELPKYSNQIIKQIPESARKSYQSYYSTNVLQGLSKSVWYSDNDRQIMEYSNYILGIDHKRSLQEIQDLLRPWSFYQSADILSKLFMRKVINKIKINISKKYSE